MDKNMPAKKKGDKTPPSKSEVLAIRINPKIRYGLDLMARKQHRSVTGVVEWAIEKSLADPKDGLVKPWIVDSSITDMLEYLWSPSPAIRLARLGIFAPDLMTFEEEKAWEVMGQNAYYWSLHHSRSCKKRTGVEYRFFSAEYSYYWPVTHINCLNKARADEDFSLIQEIAAGNGKPEDILPHWYPGSRLNDASENTPPVYSIGNLTDPSMFVVHSYDELIDKSYEITSNVQSYDELIANSCEITSKLYENIAAKLDQEDNENKKLLKELERWLMLRGMELDDKSSTA